MIEKCELNYLGNLLNDPEMRKCNFVFKLNLNVGKFQFIWLVYLGYHQRDETKLSINHFAFQIIDE